MCPAVHVRRPCACRIQTYRPTKAVQYWLLLYRTPGLVPPERLARCELHALYGCMTPVTCDISVTPRRLCSFLCRAACGRAQHESHKNMWHPCGVGCCDLKRQSTQTGTNDTRTRPAAPQDYFTAWEPRNRFFHHLRKGHRARRGRQGHLSSRGSAPASSLFPLLSQEVPIEDSQLPHPRSLAPFGARTRYSLPSFHPNPNRHPIHRP